MRERSWFVFAHALLQRAGRCSHCHWYHYVWAPEAIIIFFFSIFRELTRVFMILLLLRNLTFRQAILGCFLFISNLSLNLALTLLMMLLFFSVGPFLKDRLAEALLLSPLATALDVLSDGLALEMPLQPLFFIQHLRRHDITAIRAANWHVLRQLRQEDQSLLHFWAC